MNIFYIIKNLCDENNITIFELEKYIGISRGVLYTWKKSSPSVEKVRKVAEYFNISMDYLVNHNVKGENIIHITDKNDREIVNKFLSLNDKNNKIRVEGLIDYFCLEEQKHKDYEKELIKILKSSRSIQKDIENEEIKLPKHLLKQLKIDNKND